MASPFTADVGRIARTLPRAALRAPRALTRKRVAVALALAALLTGGYFLWFRDSSLVAVDDVEVSGLTYSEEEITGALTSAAERMTTLNADPAALEAAVEEFPTVAQVTIDPGFPHHLSIEVTERAPAGVVGGEEGVAVAGDGTVLGGIDTADAKLPAIEVEDPPASGRLSGVSLAQAEILGAAPEPLRPALRSAGVDGDEGVVVGLVEGIEIRFGDSSDAEAKWAAAAAILADPKLTELAYIDVRLPGRPAIGGAPPPEGTMAEETTELPEAPAVDPAALPAAPAPAAPPTDPAAAAPVADPATAPAAPAPAAPAPATGLAGGTATP